MRESGTRGSISGAGVDGLGGDGRDGGGMVWRGQEAMEEMEEELARRLLD